MGFISKGSVNTLLPLTFKICMSGYFSLDIDSAVIRMLLSPRFRREREYFFVIVDRTFEVSTLQAVLHFEPVHVRPLSHAFFIFPFITKRKGCEPWYVHGFNDDPGCPQSAGFDPVGKMASGGLHSHDEGLTYVMNCALVRILV